MRTFMPKASTDRVWHKLYTAGMDAEELAEKCDQFINGFRQGLFNGAVALCESPIEKYLITALNAYMALNAKIPFWFVPYEDEFEGDYCGRVFCVPQVQFGPYRVDFAIYDMRSKPLKITVVECDGHDFHERTKGQAQRDRSRDRWFVTSGVNVLRFTGSEIYRDPFAVADEISEYLERGR